MYASAGVAAAFSVFLLLAESSVSSGPPKDQYHQLPSLSLKMSPKAWDQAELTLANALSMYMS